MNKVIAFLATLILLAVPGFAVAAEFRSGETRVTIAEGEVLRDDLYVASGDVVINGTVEGDVIAAGGTVRVDGIVTGDLAVGGGDVQMSGEVRDDVRIGGGNVVISGVVGDDVLAGAGSMEITAEARVAGTVWVGAGDLTLSGQMGSVMAGTGQLRVASTARINGDLVYAIEQEDDATIESGSVVTGKTERRLSERAGFENALRVGGVVPLMTILLGLLFLYVLPNKTTKVARDWKQRFWGNTATGFLFTIGVPIAVAILFVSLIGAPLGVGALLLYPIFLYVGHLVAAIGLGTFLKNLIDKEKEPKPGWLAVVIGALGIMVIGFIPFVGWVVDALFFFAGLGALVRFDWDIITKLRSAKTL